MSQGETVTKFMKSAGTGGKRGRMARFGKKENEPDSPKKKGRYDRAITQPAVVKVVSN